MTEPLVYLAVSLAGLAVGSFVATAAIRHARGEAFFGGRSHCDGCATRLHTKCTPDSASELSSTRARAMTSSSVSGATGW